MSCRSSDGSFPALCKRALTHEELRQVWLDAGGSPSWADAMAGTAILESGGIANNVNPSDNNGTQSSWGLWQISNGDHSVPSGWDDPATNARLAIGKLSSQGAGAWPNTLANGAWKGAGSGGGSSAPQQNQFDAVNAIENFGEVIVGGVVHAAQDIIAAAEGPAGLLLAPMKFTGGAIAALSNVLENFGPFMVFVILGMIGAAMLAQAHRDEFNKAAHKIGDNLGSIATAIAKDAGEVVEVAAPVAAAAAVAL